MSEPLLVTKALNLVYRHLSRRDHSEKETVSLLEKKGYSRETISEALHILRSQGYLDDSRYLKTRLRMLAVGRGWGERKIVAALTRLGFEEKQITETLSDLPEYDRQDIVKTELARQWEKITPLDAKGKRRLFNRMLSRGFTPHDILKAMDELEEKTKHELDG